MNGDRKLLKCLNVVGQYILDTDASDTGLGDVLQQEQPDGIRVIAYASRALSNTETSYCTTRKEQLAIIYGLKQFRQHLLAREFVIRTDHAVLTHLRRTLEPIREAGTMAGLDWRIQLNDPASFW